MTQRRRITIEASEEDVEMLQAIANVTLDRDPSEPHSNPPAAERMRSLADRIEAALREEGG